MDKRLVPVIFSRTMPALKNPRHERFVQLYRQHGTARRAYRLAGYTARQATVRGQSSPLDACASRLLNYAKTQARLQELAAMAAERHEVTVDSLVAELNVARDMAYQMRQPGNITAAVMAKARVTGNIIERKEHGAPGDFATLQSPDDVIAKARAELGDDVAEMLLAMMRANGDKSEEGGKDSSGDDSSASRKRKRKPRTMLLLPPPNEA